MSENRATIYAGYTMMPIGYVLFYRDLFFWVACSIVLIGLHIAFEIAVKNEKNALQNSNSLKQGDKCE